MLDVAAAAKEPEIAASSEEKTVQHCTDMLDEVRLLTCVVATSYLCAQCTDLTPVDHWLKRVETARSFCVYPTFPNTVPSLGSRGLELGGGPPSGPHGLRSRSGHAGTSRMANDLGAQPQDWRALLCELHSGMRSLSVTPKLTEEVGVDKTATQQKTKTLRHH